MAINPNVYAQYMNQMPRGAKSGALNALTRNYDQMRQRQFQADQMKEEAAQNALRQKVMNMQIAESERLGQEREQQALALKQLTISPQPFSEVGPYAGGMQRPPELANRQADRGQQLESAVKSGLITPQQYFTAKKQDPAKGPYSHLSADMQARLSQDPRVVEQLRLKDDRDNKPETRDESKIFDQEFKLSSRFEALSAPFIKQRDAYGRIQASAEDPSPAGDLSLIFNYMKVLDPGSVVRESEFRTAAGAKAALQNAQEGGEKVPNFIMGGINRLMTGQMLLANQRGDFANRAQRLFGKAQAQHKKREKNFRNRATSYKLNPDRVVGDLSLAVPEDIQKLSDEELLGSF